MSKDGEEHVTNPLVKVLIALTSVLIVLCLVLEIQIVRRNERLDALEEQGARIEKQLDDLNTTSNRIKDIAEEFAKGDPDQAAALQELFRKIDAIYNAVVEDAGGTG